MRTKALRPFAGVDGEGGNLPCGDCRGTGRILDLDTAGIEGWVECPRCAESGLSHEYLILRANDSLLETGHPLTFQECAEFLCNLPRDVEYVSYFFDYDVTMMLRSLPASRLERLLHPEMRTGKWGRFPVEFDGYEMEYRAHAEFKIRRVGEKKFLRIDDVGTFFAVPFLTAISEWQVGDESIRKLIAENKNRRSSFTETDDETRHYNWVECQLLAILMGKFRKVCIDLGYVPHSWQGPGRLAAAILRKENVPKREELPITADILWKANQAYYGGRFETSMIGQVKGPVWQYDINSAYPAAMLKLPCLKHGIWRLRRKQPPTGSTYFAEVRYMAPGWQTGTTTAILGMFPNRLRDGSIHFPLAGSGVYWSPEIEAAQRQGWDVWGAWWWVFEPQCACVPFARVSDLYHERLRLGKSDMGRTLKLGMNSLYGKLAQSIGAAPWGNPIWAGLITSLTRAQLIDIACAGTGDQDCVMLATDGVFLTAPRDVPVNKTLGGWDCKVLENGVFIVQPGLYFGEGDKPKTRGVPMKLIQEREDQFREALAHADKMTVMDMRHAGVSIPITNFLGLRIAAHRGVYARMGQWESAEKMVTFDWSSKRRPETVAFEARGIRTLPYVGDLNHKSIPYNRMIGGINERELERMTYADIPDWMNDWHEQ